ncbi:MAG: trehalase family glycosidase [Candidatus Saccharicenans sp.]|nr:trehalase family glycosidase [Candidatus Saccharicenans sp.]MDI6848582.1 trehalase family glycosidase [Candidatus Saccharicenans sp.]
MKRIKLVWHLPLAILLTVLSSGGEIYYPWKNVFIGALDPRAWPGMTIVASPNSAFAFAPRVFRQDKLAEFNDFFYLVSEVGPHSPDGLYASMKFDLRLPFKKGRETPIFLKPTLDDFVMLVEWSRRDEQTVIGRYRLPAILDRVILVFYFPWDFKGNYTYLPASGYIHGQSAARKNEQLLCWLSLTPEKIEPVDNELHLTFKIKGETELHFAVGAGESLETINDRIYRYRSGGAINDILAEERLAYNKKRLQVSGLYEGAAEAITNNLFWMALYQNGHHRFYTPAGRGWIFPRPDGQRDHWTIFEWDSFFNSLEIAVESQKLAVDVVKAVLQTQYPNGNIPNWRGRFNGTPDRSQPPVGSFAVLKLFLRTGDRELIQFAYPYLKKWHQFWTEPMPDGHPRRDGNGDGLLEWGSDAAQVAGEVPPWEKEASGKQRAMWESGQDDLPNWDEAGFNEKTGTLAMNCVDLNSLFALDSYCLARLAEFLGKEEDRKRFLDEYEKIKKLINLHLWNEKEGFYFDRHWDGRFSSRKAASNFFPLVARIPDEKQALRMLRHLLNPDEFWGDFVIPTISRDDPAFADQQYWRGTIWPPTNYLVYQGLKAYGLDMVAADFAEKSTNLFLRIWKNYQLCPENFDSRTGEAGGQRYQSWGPLFALIGLEEYLDVTPWEGFRFGQLKPERKGILKRVSILGRHYEVELSPSRVRLIEEGRELLKTDRPAIFRHFLYSPREISFEVKSLNKNTIKLSLGTRKKGQILINGKEAGQFDGRQVEVRVPEGEQSVVIIVQD